MSAQLEVVYRPISYLIPYARNSRTHSDAQVAQIAASIKEFGFTNPVLVDDGGGIIAGHGRVLAARQLDLKSIPCIALAGLTVSFQPAVNRLHHKIRWRNTVPTILSETHRKG